MDLKRERARGQAGANETISHVEATDYNIPDITEVECAPTTNHPPQEEEALSTDAFDASSKVDRATFSGPEPFGAHTRSHTRREELTPDRGEAERHLILVDETAERFLFCTFDDVKLVDGKKRGNTRLTEATRSAAYQIERTRRRHLRPCQPGSWCKADT